MMNNTDDTLGDVLYFFVTVVVFWFFLPLWGAVLAAVACGLVGYQLAKADERQSRRTSLRSDYDRARGYSDQCRETWLASHEHADYERYCRARDMTDRARDAWLDA